MDSREAPSLINDSIAYKSTNSTDTTHFGGLFLNLGIQYKIKLSKSTFIRLGAHGNLQSNLNATRNISRATVEYNSSVGFQNIDSIYNGENQKGKITYPAAWGVGIMFEKESKWMVGAELNSANWNDYRYFGMADKMSNAWTARFGGQFIPDDKSPKFWLILVSNFPVVLSLKTTFKKYLLSDVLNGYPVYSEEIIYCFY